MTLVVFADASKADLAGSTLGEVSHDSTFLAQALWINTLSKEGDAELGYELTFNDACLITTMANLKADNVLANEVATWDFSFFTALDSLDLIWQI